MTTTALTLPQGLYGITPDWQDFTRLKAAVEQACKGGMKILQWRQKHLSFEQSLQLAPQMRELCHRHGCLFIVNDSLELALQCQADGVHLGRDDDDLKTVRQRLQQLQRSMLVGVSCYNELESAKQAAAMGADYMAFGAVYPSSTKPNATHAELRLFTELKAYLDQKYPPQAAHKRPAICAIGGITSANAAAVVAAGADCLAVITGLFETEQIQTTARFFSDLYN
ncbi:thiamine phosphate synthase [Brackiella oedipodis]|uniref:thiamine phosphate synthase n=1 Tax=Brackiella oedipodis TaxID=124225 RepID=UPI000491E668|nr:thiamine phosphate synthase [Brackiella oedipodis]